MQNYQDKQKNRQFINARSLSLEVAKHKHRLAAQLVRIILSIFYFKRIKLMAKQIQLKLTVWKKKACNGRKKNIIFSVKSTN